MFFLCGLMSTTDMLHREQQRGILWSPDYFTKNILYCQHGFKDYPSLNTTRELCMVGILLTYLPYFYFILLYLVMVASHLCNCTLLLLTSPMFMSNQGDLTHGNNISKQSTPMYCWYLILTVFYTIILPDASRHSRHAGSLARGPSGWHQGGSGSTRMLSAMVLQCT